MKNRRSKSKKRIRLRHVLVLGLIVYICSIFINQINLMKKMEGKKAILETEIKELEKEIVYLENDIENSDSLDFVEKVARDELGMVKPREIIYIDKEKSKDSIFEVLRK